MNKIQHCVSCFQCPEFIYFCLPSSATYTVTCLYYKYIFVVLVWPSVPCVHCIEFSASWDCPVLSEWHFFYTVGRWPLIPWNLFYLLGMCFFFSFWLDIDSFLQSWWRLPFLLYKWRNGEVRRESSPRTKRRSIVVVVVISHLSWIKMVI